jgi:hypothetical protein
MWQVIVNGVKINKLFTPETFHLVTSKLSISVSKNKENEKNRMSFKVTEEEENEDPDLEEQKNMVQECITHDRAEAEPEQWFLMWKYEGANFDLISLKTETHLAFSRYFFSSPHISLILKFISNGTSGKIFPMPILHGHFKQIPNFLGHLCLGFNNDFIMNDMDNLCVMTDWIQPRKKLISDPDSQYHTMRWIGQITCHIYFQYFKNRHKMDGICDRVDGVARII